MEREKDLLLQKIEKIQKKLEEQNNRITFVINQIKSRSKNLPFKPVELKIIEEND